MLYVNLHARDEAYPYTHHLVEFGQKREMRPVPEWLKEMGTPLVWKKFHRKYILSDIWNGFQSGFGWRTPCTSAISNMHSAVDNVAVIREYLGKEVSLDVVVGPVSPKMTPVGTQLSPFKSRELSKWQLIVDLLSL